MSITKARKILSKNGICWSNYFELDVVIHGANAADPFHAPIIQACQRIKRFITTGG